MPYALIVIGLAMVLSGVNGCYAALGSQLKTDFTGSQNFVIWVLAIMAVGAIGYVKDLREFSHYFLALIILAMVLSNKGFFANFSQAINQGPAQPASP